MHDIFLSYRRQDSADICDRLSDHLSRRYGSERVFRDTSTILVGSAFPQALRQALEDCRTIVVVIGPGWLDARDTRGMRRLDDPLDWVRIEVATGLREGKLVVPVLVRGGALPASHELPEDLRLLAQCQPVIVRSGPEFPGDVAGVFRALGHIARGGPPHVGLLVCCAATVLTLGAFMLSVAVPALASFESLTVLANARLIELAIGLEVLRVIGTRRWSWLAVPIASTALQIVAPSAGIFSILIILFALCALPFVMGTLGPPSSMRPLGIHPHAPPRALGVGLVALSALAFVSETTLRIVGAFDLRQFATVASGQVFGQVFAALTFLSLASLLLAWLLMLTGHLIARRWVSFLVWLLVGVVYIPVVALMAHANQFPVFLTTCDTVLVGMGWWIARQPRVHRLAPQPEPTPVEPSRVGYEP